MALNDGDINFDLLLSDAPSSSSSSSLCREPFTTSVPTTTLAKDETASLKVRQKYGLSASSSLNPMSTGTGTETNNIPLSHSKSYEEIFMRADDSFANFPDNSQGTRSNKPSGRRQYAKEVATLLAIMQCLVRRIIDELLVSGLTMENEHPLLEPLCRMIEISLYHGLRLTWGRKNSLWSLLEKIPFYLQDDTSRLGSVSAVENVRQFGGLGTGSARVRAWIQLALMNKCLGPDLEILYEAEASTVRGLYEEWALVRSDQFNTLVCLLGSLESVDFNLYVKEQSISKTPFSLDWGRFLGSDGVHFDAIQPPLVMPPSVLQQFSQSDPSSESYHTSPAGAEPPEDLMARLARLEEENRQLRRSIISQLNQRSFFEEECVKLGRRLTKLQTQLDALTESNQHYIATQLELRSIIQAHEATNESLQYQLSQAQMSQAMMGQGGNLETLSVAPTSSHNLNQLSDPNNLPSSNVDQSRRLEERVKRLEFELRMAIALKEEYKAKLEVQNKL